MTVNDTLTNDGCHWEYLLALSKQCTYLVATVTVLHRGNMGWNKFWRVFFLCNIPISMLKVFYLMPLWHFSMGTVLVKGFPQALVHMFIQSTFAWGKPFFKNVPMEKLDKVFFRQWATVYYCKKLCKNTISKMNHQKYIHTTF